jgi:hypothetical protein
LQKIGGVRLAYYNFPDARTLPDLENALILRFNPPINRTAMPKKEFVVKIGYFGKTDAISPDRVKDIVVKGNGSAWEMGLLRTINGTESNDFYSAKSVEFLGEIIEIGALKFLFEMCRAGESLPNYNEFLDCCRSYIRGEIFTDGAATSAQLIAFASQQRRFHSSGARTVSALSKQWLRRHGMNPPQGIPTDGCHVIISIGERVPTHEEFHKRIHRSYKLRSIICMDDDTLAVEFCSKYVAANPQISLKIFSKETDAFAVPRVRRMAESATTLVRWVYSDEGYIDGATSEIAWLEGEADRHNLKTWYFAIDRDGTSDAWL